MTGTEMYQIFQETAYVRMGGSEEELTCAQYIQNKCAEFGGKAVIETFEVDMATIQDAHLYIDDAALGCPLKMDSNLSDRPFVDWEVISLFLEHNEIIH